MMLNDHQENPSATPSPSESRAPAREPQYLVLALSLLRESVTNPRKSFDDLEELAASIREKGVLQPLGVRRRAGDALLFEIVFGHRRFRAAAMAGLTAIPCLVLELDDRQTAEVQVIENLQRADVHPLEEADGYAALLKEHGYTFEKLAAKIGRPPAYVRARVQLAALGTDARAAFVAGTITTGVAQVVARIADHERQAAAVARLTNYRGECVSVRAAIETVQAEFLLRLADAPFDRKSKALLPIAGACTECPKRTGAQPELFADMKTADSCTDGACFAKKREAHTKLALDQAKASGKAVLSATETKKLFPYSHSTQISYTGAYVDVNDKAFEVDLHGKKTWAQIIKGRGIATTVAVDPVGNARELVSRDALKPIVKELGGRVASSSSSMKDEDRKRREKHKRATAVVRTALGRVVDAVEADWKSDGGELVAIALAAAIDEADHLTASEVVKRRELTAETAKKVSASDPHARLHAFAEKATLAQRVALGLELLIGNGATPNLYSSKLEYGEHLRAACKLFGVDLKAIEKDLEAEHRAAKKSAPAKKKPVAAKKKGGKRA